MNICTSRVTVGRGFSRKKHHTKLLIPCLLYIYGFLRSLKKEFRDIYVDFFNPHMRICAYLFFLKREREREERRGVEREERREKC